MADNNNGWESENYKPMFPTEASMKAPIAALAADSANDVPNFPEDNGWESGSQSNGWESQQPDPKVLDAVKTMIEFGINQAFQVGQAAATPKTPTDRTVGLAPTKAEFEANMPLLAKMGRSLKQTFTPEGAASLALTVGDTLGSMVGLPGGLYNAYNAYMATGDKKLALDMLNKTQELTNVKNVLRQTGLDSKYVDSPNFLEDLFQSVQENVVDPSASKYFGDEDSIAKQVWSGIASTLIYGAAGLGYEGAKGLLKSKPVADASVDANKLKSRIPTPDQTETPKDGWESNSTLPPISPEFDTGPTLPEANVPEQPPVTYPHIDESGEPMTVPEAYPKQLPPVESQKAGLPVLDQDVIDTPHGLEPVGDTVTPEPVNNSQVPILDENPANARFMDQMQPDVSAQNSINNPYIPNGVDLENAQRAPDIGAHSEMDLRTTPKYDEAPAGEFPKIQETQFQVADGFLDRDNVFQTNPQARMELAGSHTLGDALRSVLKWGDTRDQALAERILAKGSHEDTKFGPDFTGELGGVKFRGVTYTTAGTGWREVRVNPKRVDPTTILHEAVHINTNDALHAFDNGVARPDQARYGKTVKSMMETARKWIESRSGGKLPEHMTRWFQDIREFNAYGLTDPVAQFWLHQIQYHGDTMWSKFIGALKNFFGIKDPSILENLIKMTADWKDIQARDNFERSMNLFNKMAVNYAEEAGKMPDIDPDMSAREAWDQSGRKELAAGTPQNILTTNQIGTVASHPLIRWTVAKLGQIQRQATPRFHSYADTLRPDMFGKNKLARDDHLKVFKTLVDIQDPAEKAARQAAEDSNTREQYLQSKGLSGRTLEFGMKVLDVMRDVHKADIASLSRLGRTLQYEPMYFPRIHGGRFIVRVEDSTGQTQYIKGFDTYRQAKQHELDLKNNLKDRPDLSVQDAYRAERNTFADDFSQILLEHEIPFDFLEKGVRSIEKSREAAPFAFEKFRRSENVGGYTGENISTHAEQEKLLQAMSWRLQASRNLEIKSRLLSEIKFPLFDGATLAEVPRLRMTLGYIVNRELGVDISGVQMIDKKLQKGAEIVADGFEALRHFEEKHILGKEVSDFNWADPKLGHDFVRNMVRQWTWAVSLLKLGLNSNVLASNALQPSLLAFDGIRTAALEGLNRDHAYIASMKTLLHYGGKDMGDAHEFMKEAMDQGMIEMRGQEHYTTAQLPNRRTFDRVVQAPRDVIEKATNYSSILYYYHFFKGARPDLTGEAFRAKVYEYARSFTGQYDSYAAPLMYDRTGTAGQLFTNFSKWHFNQLGRLLVDLRSIGDQRTVVPIAMTMAMTLLTAGAYGLPVVVEYEGIRRLGMALGWWDLPPISALRAKALGKLSDAAKDTIIPYWDFFERGAVTAGSDALAKFLGANSGPDISGSLRYSGFLDAPTVAVQQAWGVATQMLPAFLKEMGARVGLGSGASAADIEGFFKQLPPAVKELAERLYDAKGNQNFFKQRVTVNGKSMWRVYNPSNFHQEMYTLSDVEEAYSIAGMRSTHENRSLEGIYYEKWLERQRKNDIKSATQGILAHIGDSVIFKNNVMTLLQNGGPQAVNAALAEVKRSMTQQQYDYFTAEAIRAARTKDGIAAQQKWNNIRRARNLVE